MSDMKKFLDYEGVQHLWSKVNMNDYPNNDLLMTIISAIDETKADKNELKQSDWQQEDENSLDYIKNKPDFDGLKSDLDILKIMVNQFTSIYPVGAIYLSMNSTSPASLFGGTWERIEDTFLLGAGATYIAGSTGGESTHTLTIDEMPSHTHKYQTTAWVNKTGNIIDNANKEYIDYEINRQTQATGGSQPHNNMPPYLAVYMWKRIE